MNAVILAAGAGKRIADLTSKPKCLLEVNGRSLIERHLKHLLRNGVTNISVVTGYKNILLKKEIQEKYPGKNINIFENKYFKNGSGYSMWLARENIISDDTIIMDADVYYHPEIIDRLVSYPKESSILASQRETYNGEEYIVAVNKNGVVQEFQRVCNKPKNLIAGEAVGFYHLFPNESKMFKAILESYDFARDMDMSFEDLFLKLIKQAKMKVLDVSDLPWIEIDFKEDYENAQKLLFDEA